MGIFDKAKDLASSNPDKVDGLVDKAGDMIDERSGGKFAGQVDQGQDFVKGQYGGGQAEVPPADAPAAPADPAAEQAPVDAPAEAPVEEVPPGAEAPADPLAEAPADAPAPDFPAEEGAPAEENPPA